jgi:hypothetical protein
MNIPAALAIFDGHRELCSLQNLSRVTPPAVVGTGHDHLDRDRNTGHNRVLGVLGTGLCVLSSGLVVSPTQSLKVPEKGAQNWDRRRNNRDGGLGGAPGQR